MLLMAKVGCMRPLSTLVERGKGGEVGAFAARLLSVSLKTVRP